MAETKLRQMIEASNRYKITPRSAYRWMQANVDLNCPIAVANHILSQHAPSPAAVDAVIRLLTRELKL